MLEKADKTLQNSALQGISEQENFMIKVLFICHGNIIRTVKPFDINGFRANAKFYNTKNDTKKQRVIIDTLYNV